MKLRRLLSGFSLFCAASWLQAQDFTRLDWDVMRLDSLVPHYTEVVPLDEDFAAYDYQVSVLYPELQALTAQEVVKLSKMVSELPAVPQVATQVGISRKQGFLDLSFIPIVCRDGKYYKILSCKIAIEKKPKAALSRVAAARSGRYAATSVLAQGHWVKIRVQDDGVYMLTTADLQKMGFSDPSRVKLYGYGGHLQNEAIDADNDYDDLSEVPLYHGAKGLLFYANGTVKWEDPVYSATVSKNISTHTVNNYSRYAYYFLTEGDSPLAFPSEDYTGSVSQTVTDFVDQVLYERDEYAWFSGGRRLFDSYDYYNGNTQTYQLATPGAVEGANAALRVVFSAGATTRTTVEPEVNGTALTSFSVSSLGDYIKGALTDRTYLIRNMAAGDQGTKVKLTTTKGNHARLDFLELNYTRKLEIDEPFLDFRGESSSASEFVISNPSSRNLSVWKLGDAGQTTVQMNGTAGDKEYRVKVEKASDRYVAVDVDATFPKPEIVGEIANQNLHAIDSVVDMVIIVPQSGKLTAQAERLAEAHSRLDGMKVLVVRADQIYNEFSSGTPDATAYRRFLKMLYDRAETVEAAPRYLLLFGDAAWDNRMLSTAWKQENPEDYLLCYESDDSFSDINCYVMEDYFGLLDDGEGVSLKTEKVDLGVGRFPVTTEEDAQNLVDKTINYMENSQAGGWKNSVIILGDDGDDNLHMKSAETVAEDIEKNNPEYDLRRIYWDSFPVVTSSTGNSYPEVHSRIEEQMEEGALIVNYTGHAATYALSHEFVLVLDDFKKFSSTKVPLWVTAACDVMPFDTRTENVGETALLNPSAAALAFYGTTRTVYADDNLYMNRYFSRYVLGRDENGRRYRLGDAVRMSKVSLLDPNGDMGADNTQNKLHYALLGDPALLIGASEYRLVVDSINGTSVLSKEDALPYLSAGSLTRVSGHVEDVSGGRVPSFSGMLTARIYDSEQEVTCYNNAAAPSGAFKFRTRDKVLFSGTDSVRNGNFTITFPVPLDINYSDESGRMVLYAVSTDYRNEANGYCENFLVGGTGSDLLTDTIGPEVHVWLNDISEPEGARVNTTPMFKASLQDLSGINTSGNGVGHDLELIIDDSPTTTYNLNSYYVNEFGDYQQGTVTYILPALSAGTHKMKFRAWDAMNNNTTREYTFEVDPGLKPQISRIYATQNPARTTTNFVFCYDRPGETCSFTIEVMDFAGRKLWQHTEQGVSGEGFYTVPWNLTAGGGARLGTGVYFYRAVVTSSDGVKSDSGTNKLVIIGNK